MAASQDWRTATTPRDQSTSWPTTAPTEMLDLDQLGDGWQLTDYIADGVFRSESSYCFPRFFVITQLLSKFLVELIK